MSSETVRRQLEEFNGDENFYYAYFLAAQNTKTLHDFLAGLNIDEVLSRKLIVPEITGSWLPGDMLDEHYFDTESKNNIVLSKHNRFTPEFIHTHRFFEMTYVLSGRCAQQIGQQKLVMNEGDFCLIARDTPHSVAVFDDSVVINILVRHGTFGDIFFNLLRDDNPISTFFNQALHNRKYNPFLIIPTLKSELIQEQILTMFDEFIKKEKYYETVLDHQLMILFAKLMQGFEREIIFPEKMLKEKKGMAQMMSYITDHYQTASLHQVAKTFHFSAPYCSKLIKDYTGKSFTEIIQSLKFNRATALLSNTEETIYEISKKTGFENIEHFNRLFKKLYKMTPNQYRQLRK